MNIAVIGVGYVGLVTGTCLAELGANVWCVDKDQNKIDGLSNGVIPIYEEGLEKMVKRNTTSNRLHFSTSIEEVLPNVQIVFIAVGTPASADGQADLSYVYDVARTIGRHMTDYRLVVTKSTVPPGTHKQVRACIDDELAKRSVIIDYDVASNPEFLKEGNAIQDFMRPDRVIVGVDSERAQALMTKLYKPILLNNFRVLFMDITSAELTKYASNAMLATRISFMNEIALLCEQIGANIDMVRRGMGSDTRIGSKFLYAGCGYGGSCFPKDVQALIHSAHQNGLKMEVVEAVEAVNDRQKELLFAKFENYYKGNVKGKRVAVWGLAFKPGTDDMREAPSLVLINQLLEAGCQVVVHDPVAMTTARDILGNRVIYCDDAYEALVGVEALFHVTEWKEYRMIDWERMVSLMQHPLLIDGRNVFEPDPNTGIIYKGIGL